MPWSIPTPEVSVNPAGQLVDIREVGVSAAEGSPAQTRLTDGERVMAKQIHARRLAVRQSEGLYPPERPYGADRERVAADNEVAAADALQGGVRRIEHASVDARPAQL